MKRSIKLTESDLVRLVQKIINEQSLQEQKKTIRVNNIQDIIKFATDKEYTNGTWFIYKNSPNTVGINYSRGFLAQIDNITNIDKNKLQLPNGKYKGNWEIKDGQLYIDGVIQSNIR